MPVDRALIDRVNLSSAVASELSSRNRLLPLRWDYHALAGNPAAVATWLRPQLRRGAYGEAASMVLADKGWRGARPLHVMSLEDRVLYRALVTHIGEALPQRLRSRMPIDQFRQAPLEVPNTEYISKTDVAAYYEFVDHDLLCAELIAQTGEEVAIEALAELLASILGRRVGLPQVHPSSDVLGDTYIDPVRRRLLRRGHVVFTYSDDFRIASPSLGAARASLEACEMEVRALGLVLNERKTYTYGAHNYQQSLSSFADAEQRLFSAGGSPNAVDGLGFLDPEYSDADDVGTALFTLGRSPFGGGVDEDEVLGSGDAEAPIEIDAQRLLAAQRAWDLWIHEDESQDTQAGQDAAITQSLLGRALPTLGAGGDERPLNMLSVLLRFEPALTPQIVGYLDAYASHGVNERGKLRRALDEVVSNNILSTWQGLWLAQVAGGVGRPRHPHKYVDWLADCAKASHDGLAATAAAALGRVGRGDPDLVTAVVARVNPAWRRLAFCGLIGLDHTKAVNTADDELDRLLLAAAGVRQ